MSALDNYKAMAFQIKKANRWKDHLTAIGHNGDRCQIHSIGAEPKICIQYSHGSKNYWERTAV